MYKKKFLALCALLIILAGFPASIFAYQYLYLPATYGRVKVIDLVGHTPEVGGWSPEVITVNKGDTVRLRITSSDVVHGFAIGKMGIDVGQIIPGEVTTVEFVADKVGRFTYYCNVWCSPYHYRMRGTLEVVDPSAPEDLLTSGEESPTIFQGLDIDAPHEAKFYPSVPPSATRGRDLAAQSQLPTLGPRDLHAQSPSTIFQTIRRQDSTGPLSDEEIWDLVAYLWSTTTTPERIKVGEALYTRNCVGCHGETGGGRWPWQPLPGADTGRFHRRQDNGRRNQRHLLRQNPAWGDGHWDALLGHYLHGGGDLEYRGLSLDISIRGVSLIPKTSQTR